MTDKTTVAYTREADEHVGGLAGDDEIAGRCGHATIDERGVARAEHGDVDKLHGLSLLVDDAARELMVFLLYALHEDHVGQQVPLAVLTFALDHFHSDGVEADDLTDGVGYALLAHVSGDLEVLKIVVSKVDDILSRDGA